MPDVVAPAEAHAARLVLRRPTRVDQNHADSHLARGQPVAAG